MDDLGVKPTIFGNIHMILQWNHLPRVNRVILQGYHLLTPAVLQALLSWDLAAASMRVGEANGGIIHGIWVLLVVQKSGKLTR